MTDTTLCASAQIIAMPGAALSPPPNPANRRGRYPKCVMPFWRARRIALALRKVRKARDAVIEAYQEVLQERVDACNFTRAELQSLIALRKRGPA